MLTFLAPAALVGLSLLAIPIVIHLLKPRKMRRTPFSSLRWLQLTQQKLSRRLRLHQLLLLMLRAAFIALLVLAVAKPIVDRRREAVPVERFVVLDVSRSMGYRAGDEPTPLENGKRAAARILAENGPEDKTTLLTVAAETKVVGAPARGGERYAAKLGPLETQATGTDLGSALETVRTLLGRRTGDARVELVLISDRQQGSCRPEEVAAFAGEFGDRLSTVIVDTSHPKAANGWIAEAVFIPARPGAVAAIDVRLNAVGAPQERTIRLRGIDSRDDRSRTITLDPQSPPVITFELPADFDPKGKTCEIVLDPPDGLPTDDRSFLTLSPGPALDVLLVEGRDRAGVGTSAGFELRTAIESLSTEARPIHVAVKKFNDVQPADFAAVEAVFLVDVPQVSETAVEALKARVRDGVGLGIFLGPDVDVEFYNRRLIDPLDRSKRLLPASLDRFLGVVRRPDAEVAVPWEAADAKHPLLAGLADPIVGDIGSVRTTTYFRFKDFDERDNSVAIRVQRTPLLVERRAGQGTVVLFNTTADDAWSDLPRRKSFVPLIDRVLARLTGGATKRTFTTAEPIVVAVPAAAIDDAPKIIAPDGKELVPSIAKAGNSTRLTLPPQSQAGVYRIRNSAEAARPAGETESTFVVEVDRADSLLTPIDEDRLRSWWPAANFTFVRAEAVAQSGTAERPSLVGWALIGAAILLALELLVVHRLCPRMNPRSAEAIVRSRPIVSAGDRADVSSTPATAVPNNA